MTESADNIARLLAGIVESSDDAIVSKDVHGIVRSWNRAAERMFGFTADEMIGQSIRTIIPADRQHEEDRVLSAIVSGERVEHFETVRRTKSGSFIPVSLTVSPIRDATGLIVGASKIARDISDRKLAEMRVERAIRREAFLAQVTLTLTRSLDIEETLKSLAALAVPTIADYCVIDLLSEERHLVRVTGIHGQTEKALLAHELVVGSDSDSPLSPVHAARTGKPSFTPRVTDEMTVTAAEGDSERLAQIRSLGLASHMCVPMIAHGRTLGVLTLANAESSPQYAEDDLSLAEDVASRAAQAIENAQSYEQAQTANRLKDEFLATLSHELRTPLNAVLGYVRMLRSGAIRAERVEQALEVVERNASSLAQIVEDVLDVSRIISGKARLDVRPTDIAAVVKDAVATVTPAADAKGLKVTIAIDPHVGPVSGDSTRLRQVAWNLLSNAVKFTPRGGRVLISLNAEDSHIELVVSDTGIGFSPEFLPYIFERFRQAESGTTRRHGGLGLGLAISRHIVEMHGGTIHAASDGEGKGATFRVRLPLTISDSPAGAEAERKKALTQSRSEENAPDLSGVRVMAVDSDEDALRLVREILESAGAEVVTVGSGAAALDHLAVDRPHVILSELGMPEMDGWELIKRIRELPDPSVRRIPAAALTAYARSTDRTRALRSGFEIHLAKPVELAELIAAVASLARRQEP